MVGLNSALYIGRDALMAHQLAISVTGQNIANVNTTGYSRQRVILESKVINSAQGPIGAGVIDKGIVRSYDQFLNAHIQEEIQQKGIWQAESQSMQQVEIVFDEASGDGLSQHMSNFWNAWQDLTLNPSGYAERKALVTASEDLASNFQEKYQDLDQIQIDLDGRITAATGEINTLASSISDLNDKIVQMELNGSSANEFRDQRDVLINQLSEKINFTTREDSQGRVTLTLGDDHDLVGNPPFGKLKTVTNVDTKFKDLEWDSLSGTTPIDNINISAGNLSGWMNVRDSLVPGYKDQLNALAKQIIDQVNAVHKTGKGLDVPLTKNDFFSGDSASTIQVNPDITADVNKIAAAGDVSSELIKGDNTNALEMAKLQNNLTMDGSSATFDTFFNTLISRVGSDVKNASMNLEHHTATVEQMENYRESVSGVSLDEEMVNLVKFQQGYSAAAKVIDTVKQMMDTVINMV
jgi:flagellar hook-associated protein 1 FlgK